MEERQMESQWGQAGGVSTSPPSSHREALACFMSLSAGLLEPPVHVGFDDPEGSQRNNLLYAVPSKVSK